MRPLGSWRLGGVQHVSEPNDRGRDRAAEGSLRRGSSHRGLLNAPVTIGGTRGTDVVQNFCTAIWFATHRFSDQGSFQTTTVSEEDWGWISFYVRKHPNKSKYLKVTDLPGDHSSRRLRPHTQQGASLAKQYDEAAHCERDQDLNEYRIAQVCFPNSTRWALSGYTFSVDFLFPPATQDNSLEQLRRPQVQKMLDDACIANDLPIGTLGTVSHYR